MPIEDRDFDDFIIVDPMGVVPAIYVYFKKAPVEEYEVDYYENFEGRSRQGKYQVDHIPSRESANKQVISSQADSLIKISRIWAD
ncbi:hypothetical protein ELO54_28735, partial [Klebsiella pneumoniae]|nr:hypothetical protein [Klebsiella pneumoniae]MBL2736898.1 hypothetical protein [Klebsiella pneumoniae]MBL2742413.1 hypothetical protein [Klebsiella pneumoniae]MBL2765167.1 hypothetical protein [Klebsiella pneumoniae]MBL2776234.1 hypothetical protein [Klebsiella pneumoniae]